MESQDLLLDFELQAALLAASILFFQRTGPSIRVDNLAEAKDRLIWVVLASFAGLFGVTYFASTLAAKLGTETIDPTLFVLLDIGIVGLVVTPASFLFVSRPDGPVFVDGYLSAARVGLTAVLLRTLVIVFLAPEPAPKASPHLKWRVDPGVKGYLSFSQEQSQIEVGLEDDGQTGIFHLVAPVDKEKRVLCSTIAYDNARDLKGERNVPVCVMWSRDSSRVLVGYREVWSAAFNFETRQFYSTIGSASPSTDWSYRSWDTDEIVRSFPGMITKSHVPRGTKRPN